MDSGPTSHRLSRRVLAAAVLAIGLAVSAVSAVGALRPSSIDESFYADQQAVRGERRQVGPAAVVPPFCLATDALILGDSLTVGADQFGGLSYIFAATGYKLEVDAAVAKFTSTGAKAIESRAAAGTLQPVVIAALGTNDASAGYTVSWFAGNVDRVMAAVGPNRVVLWVNLQMADQVLADRFNGMLYLKSLQYSNLLIADWANTPNRQYLAGDGIHYSPTGYKNRAAYILDRTNWATCRTLPY